MKMLRFFFGASLICIILAFSLLLLFKTFHISGPVPAYTTAALAFIGGFTLIISSLRLLSPESRGPEADKLLFDLPEFLVLGLVFMVFSVFLLIGKHL